MKLPKYVQAWVDREGRSHHYFRRRGYPRIRLPGLPWSPPFMEAYQAALEGPALAIGAKRVKPGSAHAAQIGVSEVTYYRWRQEFGGLKIEQVKRLKELELENSRLRKAVSDLTLDKLILQEAARGNF